MQSVAKLDRRDEDVIKYKAKAEVDSIDREVVEKNDKIDGDVENICTYMYLIHWHFLLSILSLALIEIHSGLKKLRLIQINLV